MGGPAAYLESPRLASMMDCCRGFFAKTDGGSLKKRDGKLQKSRVTRAGCTEVKMRRCQRNYAKVPCD